MAVMKLHILSDLHLSTGAVDPAATDADVIVLAGDLGRPAAAVEWALRFPQPVLYVPGNHEFYGGSLDGTVRELRERTAGGNIHLLDNDALVLGGVRFLGSTLWSDFRLDDAPERRAHAVAEAQRLVRDFSRIRLREAEAAVFSPADSTRLFDRNVAWLAARLDEPHAGPTVVITHHGPSPRSVHPRFAGSPLNAAFVSDAEHLMGAERVALWIHGHLHDSFDYAVRGTRVLCNPRGYFVKGTSENPRFDPGLVVEVGG
jgi:predicted phosphodiesterase